MSSSGSPAFNRVLMEKTDCFSYFYVPNLSGAVTQTHITTVGDANESSDQLGFSGFHIFCESLSSLESNETQSYDHVKAINLT